MQTSDLWEMVTAWFGLAICLTHLLGVIHCLYRAGHVLAISLSMLVASCMMLFDIHQQQLSQEGRSHRSVFMLKGRQDPVVLSPLQDTLRPPPPLYAPVEPAGR